MNVHDSWNMKKGTLFLEKRKKGTLDYDLT